MLNWTYIQNKLDGLIVEYGKALENGTTSGTVVFTTEDASNYTYSTLLELSNRIDALKAIIATLKSKSAKSWKEHLADIDAHRDILINNGAFDIASKSANGVSVSRNSMMDYLAYRKEVVALANKEDGNYRIRVISF